MSVQDAGVERRQHSRYSVRVPLYVSLEGDIYNKMVKVRTLDLSKGGLAFETGKALPIDGRTRLVLSKLGDLPESAHIQGRVVLLNRLGGGRYRVGVQFTKFVEVTADDLVARLRTWEQDQQALGAEETDGENIKPTADA